MSSEYYIIAELFILFFSTIVTYFFVNRRKSFDSYVATWKKLGTRIIWFLFLLMLLILYCYFLNINITIGTMILFTLIFFAVTIVDVILLCILYEIFNKRKAVYKLRTLIKYIKEKINSMSEMRFDTLCKISYIFEIVFILMVLFTTLSLILYFYANSIYNDNKQLKSLLDNINIVYSLTILCAYFFWVCNFLFTWFKLKNCINDRKENDDYKEHVKKIKHENMLDRFDRSDIKI